MRSTDDRCAEGSPFIAEQLRERGC